MSRRSRFTKVVGFENNRPARGGRWRTIWNLNFKKNDIQTTGALTENAGALTTLEGVQYHCRVNSTSDQSWTITADTGLVVDFASSSSAIGRLDLKVPHFAQYPDGSWPRMRISASFSGLVVSHNSDYIAAGIGSMWRNNSAPYRNQITAPSGIATDPPVTVACLMSTGALILLPSSCLVPSSWWPS